MAVCGPLQGFRATPDGCGGTQMPLLWPAAPNQHARSQVPLWRVRFSSDTLYGADFVKGVPRGAYRYFSTSVSLFDLDNPFPRPDPHGMRWPARAEAVKDGA